MSNTTTVNDKEKKRTFTHDDITHALAYGYGGRRRGQTHAETLKAYKDANNL